MSGFKFFFSALHAERWLMTHSTISFLNQTSQGWSSKWPSAGWRGWYSIPRTLNKFSIIDPNPDSICRWKWAWRLSPARTAQAHIFIHILCLTRLHSAKFEQGHKCVCGLHYSVRVWEPCITAETDVLFMVFAHKLVTRPNVQSVPVSVWCWTGQK